MIVYVTFLVKKRPFKQYLGKIMKVKQPKKPETRTKVDFLIERANILSEGPAPKIGSKMKKKASFLRQTLTQVSKK